MSTAPRYYLVADDGKIHRLARATFYKLLEQKIPTPFPEFNGRRVKLATVNDDATGAPDLCAIELGQALTHYGPR